MTDHIEITLTSEELLYLFASIGVQSLVGMGGNPVRGLEPEVVQRMVVAGFNSLRARGLLELDSEANVKVDSLPVALVGQCARASNILFFNRQSTVNKSEKGYFHLDPDFSVLHTSPNIGIHRFEGFVEAKLIHDRLQHLYSSLPNSSLPRSPWMQTVQITPALFEDIRQLTFEERSVEATERLVASGVSRTIAKELIATLSELTENTIFALIPVVQLKTREAQSLATLSSSTQLWKIESSEEIVSITPINTDNYQATLRRFVGIGINCVSPEKLQSD